MSDYMEFDIEPASPSEKKKERAKKIKAVREANANTQRQEAALSSLARTYQNKYPDVFKDRYPHGINTNRRDRDKMIRQLEAEMTELENDYVPIKRRYAAYDYNAPGGEKTTVNRKVGTETRDDSFERKRKTGNYDLEAALNEQPNFVGERALVEVDKAVKKKDGLAVLGEVFKQAFRAGVSYLTGGQPYIADIALNAITALWNQRKNIAEAWRKMKNWFSGLGKKRLTIEHVADNIDKLAGVPIKSVPEFDKTFLNFGLRKTIIDLLKANSEVAKILFENPTKENILSLLQKYKGSSLPPGTVEACQTLLNKDIEIHNILNEASEAKKSIENATYSFREALERGDLVSANGALTPVTTGGIKSGGGDSGPAVIQGFTDEMVMNTELYKKLHEEFLKSRNQVFENMIAAERLRQEQNTLKVAFDNKAVELKKAQREVQETSAVYEERVSQYKADLDAKTTQYNQAAESLALTQSNLRTAEADRDGYKKQFIEATKQNEKLTLELQAIAAKGEQQSVTITGLNSTIEEYKERASIFQKMVDESEAKLKEKTNQKEAELAALKEENRLVAVDKEKRIIELTDKINELTDQVNTQNDIITQGNKLLEDRAKEIVTLQAQGNDNNALIETYKEERRKITAERERFERSNFDLGTQIATLEHDKNVLVIENNNYKSKIDQLESQVAAGREAQGKLNNVNAGFKSKIEQLEKLSEKQKTDNIALQKQVAELIKEDSANKQALALVSKENVLLKEEKEEIREGAAAKYRMQDKNYSNRLKESDKKLREAERREADLRRQIEASNKKYDELAKQQEEYQKRLNRHMRWFGTDIQRGRREALEENLVTVEALKVGQAVSADEARDNLWKAMRGDYQGMTKSVAGSTGGAYLVGSAPDWNLQPNERIQQFWSKFYDLSFHPY